jgi:hypothetical protein
MGQGIRIRSVILHCLIYSGFFIFVSINSNANIIHVPDDYPSIQMAIDTANSGDTVLVAPGIYHENVNISSDHLYLLSHYFITGDTSIISQTIIEGDMSTYALYVNGYQSGVEVNGFTVRNGRGGVAASGKVYLKNMIVRDNEYIAWQCKAAGIRLDGFTGIMENVEIMNNLGNYYGGGVSAMSCTTVFRNVNIHDNICYTMGGGIYSRDSEITIINSVIDNNSGNFGGGLDLFSGNDFTFINTIISNNWGSKGGGLEIMYSNVTFINSNIVNNVSNWEGSGFWSRASTQVILNSIFYNNESIDIAFHSMYDTSNCYIAYSNIEDGIDSIMTNNNCNLYWMDGNIDVDPLFKDPSMGGWALKDASECIGAGIDSIFANQTWVVSPEFDFYDSERPCPQFSNVDLGAIENSLGNPVYLKENIPSGLTQIIGYPNPFTTSTTIEYELTEPTNIQLTIYNHLGEAVEEAVNGCYPPGAHTYVWGAERLSEGMYFAVFRSGDGVSVVKLIKQ